MNTELFVISLLPILFPLYGNTEVIYCPVKINTADFTVCVFGCVIKGSTNSLTQPMDSNMLRNKYYTEQTQNYQN